MCSTLMNRTAHAAAVLYTTTTGKVSKLIIIVSKNFTSKLPTIYVYDDDDVVDDPPLL